MVTIGVDLHKRISQIAVLTPEGEVVQHRLDNDPEKMERFFAKIPSPAHVAIEACATWWWLVDILERLGHRPVLSHPKQTKAIAAARLKNDRVDAERLALLLRADLLPTVWIPPATLREARELVRHRIGLVWLRTRVKNQLHALLARRNLQPTSSKSWMTIRGQRELTALPLGAAPSVVRENCFWLLHLLDEQIRHLDADLVSRWGQDPRVQRLMTIPGIGPFVAILLVLELGDIHRFPMLVIIVHPAEPTACFWGELRDDTETAGSGQYRFLNVHGASIASTDGLEAGFVAEHPYSRCLASI